MNHLHRLVLGGALALSSCSGGASTVPSALHSAHAASAAHLSLTITRSAANTPRTDRRRLTIPATTTSIVAQAWAGTTRSQAPLSAACTPFPASQQSATISVAVPIGVASVEIDAYDGACNGTTSTGTLLALFGGTGTVTVTSTSFAEVFNGGSPVHLSLPFPIVADVPPRANTWNSIGPANYAGGEAGKLNSVVVMSSGKMLAAGGIGQGYEVGTQAGVFATTGIGFPWSPSNSGLTDAAVNSMLALDDAGSVIVLATETGGIFVSRNAGASWTNVFVPPGLFGSVGVYTLSYDGTTVFAACAGGIAQSSDGGSTWSMALAAPHDFLAVASIAGIAYAGASDGSLYARTGATWNRVGQLPADAFADTAIHAIAIDPASPNMLLASENSVTQLPTGAAATQILYASADGGKTWTTVPLPSAIRGSQSIAASVSVPHEFYIGGTQLYTTTDLGKTLTSLASYGDGRGLLIKGGVGNADVIYATSDQGFAISTDAGKSFNAVSGGITNNVIFDVAASLQTVITGVQDYSPFVSFNGGATWNSARGPDFFEDGFAYINPHAAQYCYLWDSSFHASSDGCQTFRTSPLNAHPSGSSGAVFAPDAHNASLLYIAASDGVYRSADAGMSFAPTNWPISNPTSIYVGSDSTTVFVSSSVPNTGVNTTNVSLDGGATFSKGGGLPLGQIAFVQLPQDASLVIGVAPDSNGGLAVYRSTDGGISFQQSATSPSIQSRHRRIAGAAKLPQTFPWTNAFFSDAQGVGAISRICVTDASISPAKIALTTTAGVYVSADYGLHWHAITANAISHAFQGCTWRGNTLLVATAGQGVLNSSPLF